MHRSYQEGLGFPRGNVSELAGRSVDERNPRSRLVVDKIWLVLTPITAGQRHVDTLTGCQRGVAGARSRKFYLSEDILASNKINIFIVERRER
jgi:hypothetical protein